MIVALCAPDLAPVVDLVVWVEDGTPYAANHLGRVRLHDDSPAEVVVGGNPLGSEDPMAFLPYEREVADPSPRVSTDNAYPLAATRLRSFFADADRSPDLAVVHTPRHFFPEQGGHVGEHGSLDVIQSRAPLVLSGAGVPRRGYVDSFARLVDVGPTLAHLAGVPDEDLLDADGRALDGRVLHRAPRRRRRPGRTSSGCSGTAHTAATCCTWRRPASCPAVARLLERGLALRGGAVAEFPTMTLTNHTSILTGVGPGRHGVMGNVYYDRATGERVVPNDAVHLAPQRRMAPPGGAHDLRDGRGARAGRHARTACVDEAIDRGARLATMSLIRESGESGADAPGRRAPRPRPRRTCATPPSSRTPTSAGARVSTTPGSPRCCTCTPTRRQRPRLTWWANVVTDAGHHGGGPRSEIARDALRQSDARLVTFLDHLDGLGLTEDVTFLLTADHGFEGGRPDRHRIVDGGAGLGRRALPRRGSGPGLPALTALSASARRR